MEPENRTDWHPDARYFAAVRTQKQEKKDRVEATKDEPFISF